MIERTECAGPDNGVVTELDPEHIEYVGETDFFGVDTFVYEVDDGVTTAQGTVTVIVTAVSEPPKPEAPPK